MSVWVCGHCDVCLLQVPSLPPLFPHPKRTSSVQRVPDSRCRCVMQVSQRFGRQQLRSNGPKGSETHNKTSFISPVSNNIPHSPELLVYRPDRTLHSCNECRSAESIGGASEAQTLTCSTPVPGMRRQPAAAALAEIERPLSHIPATPRYRRQAAGAAARW